MNWYQVTVTHKTWLFSLCEPVFVVFTEKTFPFKDLEDAKEKGEQGAPPLAGEAADLTFWCVLPSPDEAVVYDTHFLILVNVPWPRVLFSGLAAAQPASLGRSGPRDDLSVEPQPTGLGRACTCSRVLR